MKAPKLLTLIISAMLVFVFRPAAHAQTEPQKSPAPPVPPGAVAAAPQRKPLPANLKLSAWAKEIVKLAEAGIDEEVMLSFVDNSGTFNLGADQIIFLKDIGVPSAVVTAMLRHDQEIIAGLRTLTISSDPGYEPLMEIKIAPVAAAPTKNTEPPQPPPTETFPAVATETRPAATAQSSPEPPPVTTHDFPPNESAPLVQPAIGRKPAPTGKKKFSYPVRSPHPEPLLPPILVVRAVTRAPNLFIIEGFPPE